MKLFPGDQDKSKDTYKTSIWETGQISQIQEISQKKYEISKKSRLSILSWKSQYFSTNFPKIQDQLKKFKLQFNFST